MIDPQHPELLTAEDMFGLGLAALIRSGDPAIDAPTKMLGMAEAQTWASLAEVKARLEDRPQTVDLTVVTNGGIADAAKAERALRGR